MSTVTLATGRAVKKTYLEILRILSCFFVIFNHTGQGGYFLFSVYDPSSLRYWVFLFISVFSKFAVPVFFAISGALLIPKDESLAVLYRKRVLKQAVVLLLISAFFYLLNNDFNFSKVSLRTFFGLLYTSSHKSHLWFMYSYLIFLISLPLLRPMIRSLKNEHFLYLLIFYLIFNSLLPIAEFIVFKGEFSINPDIRMDWVLSPVVIYPAIGYYLENRMDINRGGKRLPLLWAINILGILLSCAATCYHGKVTGTCDEAVSQVFFSSFSIINMITVYVTVKYLSRKRGSTEGKGHCLAALGSCTFGIYLIHPAIMRFEYELGFSEALSAVIPFAPMLTAMLVCAVTFIISALIVFMYKCAAGKMTKLKG